MTYPGERLTLWETFRLARYRAAHQGAVIGHFSASAWQARFSHPDGETVITGRTFAELMDKLDDLDAEPDTL